MPTITVGYDWTTGGAKTFTTIAAAQADAGTADGDILDLYASNSTGNRRWIPASTSLTKGIVLRGTLANAGVQLSTASNTTYTVELVHDGAGLTNLTLDGSYANTQTIGMTGACAGQTWTVRECILYGANVNVIRNITTSSGSAISTFNCINCLIISACSRAYAADVNGTPPSYSNSNFTYCTIIGSSQYGLYAPYKTCTCTNVVVVDAATCFYGNALCFVLNTCASTDNTQGVGGVQIQRGQSDPKFWRNQSGSMNPLDWRIPKDSALANVGTDASAITTTDFFGNTRTQFDIGFAAAWDLPVVPAASVIKLNDTTGRAVAFPGATVTGTLSTTTPSITVPAPVPVALGATETTIYTCPAGTSTSVRVLHLCNTDSSARTVTIHKVKVTDTAADDNAELKGQVLGIAGTASSVYNLGPITLTAGDILSGLTDSAGKVTAIAEVFELDT
jgi:hypothetical protein